MTLPNKLTVARLWMTPVFFFAWYVFYRLGLSPRAGSIILWLLFSASEITDLLDGHIARSRNLVSDVGKVIDPFADVFLRVTYFVFFLSEGLMPVWALVIILWRELGILIIRMLLIREGEALAASRGGKSKALLYFVSGVVGLFVLTLRAWRPDFDWIGTAERVSSVLFIAAAAAALLSFADYWRHFSKSGTYRKFMDE